MGKIRYILAIYPIKLYQYLISPYFGNCCRFYPSCSQYMIEAIEKKGIFKGLTLGIYRLLRCHPWAKGGIDPVCQDKTTKA